jgi:hypothetical protein
MDIIVWTGGLLVGSPTSVSLITMQGGVLAGGAFFPLP